MERLGTRRADIMDSKKGELCGTPQLPQECERRGRELCDSLNQKFECGRKELGSLSIPNGRALANDKTFITALANNLDFRALIGAVDPTNVRYVSPDWIPVVDPVGDGVRFNTISEALASITDAAINNQYLILVWPGMYSGPGTLNLKSFVHMTSLGGATILQDVVYNGDVSSSKKMPTVVLTGFTFQGTPTVTVAAAISAVPLKITYTVNAAVPDNMLVFALCTFNMVWFDFNGAATSKLASTCEFRECRIAYYRLTATNYVKIAFKYSQVNEMTPFGMPGPAIGLSDNASLTIDSSFVFNQERGANIFDIRTNAFFQITESVLVTFYVDLEFRGVPVVDGSLPSELYMVNSYVAFDNVRMFDATNWYVYNTFLYVFFDLFLNPGASAAWRGSTVRGLSTLDIDPTSDTVIHITSDATHATSLLVDNTVVDAAELLINTDAVGAPTQPATVTFNTSTVRTYTQVVIGTAEALGPAAGTALVNFTNTTLTTPVLRMRGGPGASVSVNFFTGNLTVNDLIRVVGAQWTVANISLWRSESARLEGTDGAIIVWSSSPASFASIDLSNGVQWYVSDGSVRWGAAGATLGDGVFGYFTNADAAFATGAPSSTTMTLAFVTTTPRINRTFEVVKQTFLGAGDGSPVLHGYNSAPNSLNVVPYITPPTIATHVLTPLLRLDNVPVVVSAPAPGIDSFATQDNYAGDITVLFTLTQQNLPLHA